MASSRTSQYISFKWSSRAQGQVSTGQTWQLAAARSRHATTHHSQQPLAREECAAGSTATSTWGVSRRVILLSLGATNVLLATWNVEPARAGLVDDAARGFLRPEVPQEHAIVALLDARGVLYELRDLAATPPGSDERFHARRLLPGFAKRLREVGTAAPMLVALVQEGGKEATLSPLYGGQGKDSAGANPLYEAIGDIVTISGRTIREEAQGSPQRAEVAIMRIEALLAKLPAAALQTAKDMRRMQG